MAAGSRRAVLAFLAALGLLAAPLHAAAASDTYAWHEGADGYATALAAARGRQEPFLLLFSLAKSDESRRLWRQYLEVSPVEDLAGEYLRVVVDPGDGPAERALAEEWLVRDYPTLFVAFPGGRTPQRISPFGGRLDRTPYEFHDLLREALAMTYYERACALIDGHEYPGAERFLRAALALWPTHPGSWYGLGLALWRSGREQQDPSRVREAQTCFAQTLELVPDHAGARRELDAATAQLEGWLSGK